MEILTSSGAIPPGIRVPSFEQKQYGSSHSARSHFLAKSTGVSVIGAGAKVELVWLTTPIRDHECILT